LPHLRVQVLDDDGQEAELGEICVSAASDGPWAGQWTPMLGEWRDGAVVPGPSLLRTGDVGSLDDGWLRIRDRLKLIVVRGGANVYPAEVERVLLEAPGVAAGAVFGVPDERLGERVVAVVEVEGGAALDEEAVRAHCLAHLAKYKVPERFVAVAKLPRNAMGKIVRAELPGLSGPP
jgi:long-chain acyl-CoA synthetase